MRFTGFMLAAVLAGSTFIGNPVASAAQEAGTRHVDAAKVASEAAVPPSGKQGVTSGSGVHLESVKTAFELRFEGLEVTEVKATPVPGLYEVQVGTELIYVDAQVDYVFQGSLIDANTREDLTAGRLQQLSEVPFDTLPVEHAIKIVKGDGSRKLAVFEDPNCIYCKQLHASLKDIDNITVYSFQFPILSPDSVMKSRNIWCAPDSSAVLQAWMVDGKVPEAAQCDDNPVEQVLELGRKLMVRGTPAILFADGSRANGALPADELRLKLDTMN